MAMIMRSDEDPSLAKKHFYKALEINPEYALAYFELGNHTVNHGDFNEAKLHFQKATDLDQNFVLAYFHLGKILTNPSEYSQAYRNYETALEIEPELAECHYWFAKLLSKGEKLKSDGSIIKEPEILKARHHLEKAIQIDNNFSKAYYKLGILQVTNKEYTMALKNFEEAIKFNNNFAEAHYQIALLLMNENAKNELITPKKRSQKNKVSR
jgi:tetratricopeptide (TPR) repeat protein